MLDEVQARVPVSWQYTWRKHRSLSDLAGTWSTELSLVPWWCCSHKAQPVCSPPRPAPHFGSTDDVCPWCAMQVRWWEAVWAEVGWTRQGMPGARQEAKNVGVRDSWSLARAVRFLTLYFCLQSALRRLRQNSGANAGATHRTSLAAAPGRERQTGSCDARRAGAWTIHWLPAETRVAPRLWMSFLRLAAHHQLRRQGLVMCLICGENPPPAPRTCVCVCTRSGQSDPCGQLGAVHLAGQWGEPWRGLTPERQMWNFACSFLSQRWKFQGDTHVHVIVH